LFDEERYGKRRRIARGSIDVAGEPPAMASEADPYDAFNDDDEDDVTPVVDLGPPTAESELRRRVRERSLKPTTPISRRADSSSDNASSPEVPVEDRSSPGSASLQARAPHAAIPLDDLQTPIVELSLADSGPPLPLTRLASSSKRLQTPREIEGVRLLAPVAEEYARLPTGPHLPAVADHDQPRDPADAPTNISEFRDEFEHSVVTPTTERDPWKDVTPRLSPQPPARPHTSTAEIVVPPSWRWGPSSLNKVAQCVKPTRPAGARTWLAMCALFAIAAIVAIVIALL
jgi:hypothetical protein